MKILHVLNHSVPHTDGYCVRSENIVRHQKSMGWSPVVVTSSRHEPEITGPIEEIAGIKYYRSLHDTTSIPVLREFSAINKMASRIDEVVEAENPAIIHAHSPCLWGRSAQKVARKRKIPFVYEVRGVWEEGLIDQGRCTRRSPKYQMSRQLETLVARNADALVTISDALKQEFSGRGAADDRVFVVPNGVTASQFSALSRDEELASKYGLKDAVCISYIGSLYPWEGVDCLIRAMPEILSKLPNAQLLIVGKGEEQPALQNLVAELGCEQSITLTGHVQHSEVSRYYSLADILAYPRRSSRQTELVTPLKPLEALCMEKAIVASDVGGIRELLGEAGTFFKADDPSALARACIELASDAEARLAKARAGRKYALENRDWKHVIKGYETVYSSVLGPLST